MNVEDQWAAVMITASDLFYIIRNNDICIRRTSIILLINAGHN